MHIARDYHPNNIKMSSILTILTIEGKCHKKESRNFIIKKYLGKWETPNFIRQQFHILLPVEHKKQQEVETLLHTNMHQQKQFWCCNKYLKQLQVIQYTLLKVDGRNLLPTPSGHLIKWYTLFNSDTFLYFKIASSLWFNLDEAITNKSNNLITIKQTTLESMILFSNG